MSASLNAVTLVGRLGRDPETRDLESGSTVANLSVATKDYAGKQADGSPKEETSWHRVTAWNRLADAAHALRKGDLVLVQGVLRYSTSEDAKGQKRYWTEIVAQKLLPLGGRQRDEVEQNPMDRPGLSEPRGPTPNRSTP